MAREIIARTIQYQCDYRQLTLRKSGLRYFGLLTQVETAREREGEWTGELDEAGGR